MYPLLLGRARCDIAVVYTSLYGGDIASFIFTMHFSAGTYVQAVFEFVKLRWFERFS